MQFSPHEPRNVLERFVSLIPKIAPETSPPRCEPDVPGDLLRAIFGNMTESSGRFSDRADRISSKMKAWTPARRKYGGVL
jgi:hypothetical protein